MRFEVILIFFFGLISCTSGNSQRGLQYENGTRIENEFLSALLNSLGDDSSCSKSAINLDEQKRIEAVSTDFVNRLIADSTLDKLSISIVVTDANSGRLLNAYSSNNRLEALTEKDQIGRLYKSFLVSLYLDKNNVGIDGELPSINSWHLSNFDEGEIGKSTGIPLVNAFSKPMSRPRIHSLIWLYTDATIDSWLSRFDIEIKSKAEIMSMELSLLELTRNYSIFLSQGDLYEMNVCGEGEFEKEVLSSRTASKMIELFKHGDELWSINSDTLKVIGQSANNWSDNVEYFIGLWDNKVIGIKLNSVESRLPKGNWSAIKLMKIIIEH